MVEKPQAQRGRIDNSRLVDTRVRDTWYRAYERGEKNVPNTILGLNIGVGRAAMRSIRLGLATVREFADSGTFGPKQMDQAVETVILFHTLNGIPLVPKE